MALGTPNLLNTATPNLTNTITSGSFTPTANAQLFVVDTDIGGNTAANTGYTITDSLGAHLTYTLIGEIGGNTTAAGIRVWTALVGASPVAMTVTSSTAGSPGHHRQFVYEVTGVDAVTPTTGAVTATGGTSSTPQTPVGATPDTSDQVHYWVVARNLTTAITGATGFTQIAEAHNASPSATTQGGYKTSTTSTTVDPSAMSAAWNGEVAYVVKLATIPGAAAITATATLGATGVVTENAVAAITAIGSLSAGATQTFQAAAAITATGSLSAGGLITRNAAASITATASLSAAGIVTRNAAVAITATATLSAGGLVTEDATASITATAVLTATATVVIVIPPPGTLSAAPSGSATLSAVPSKFSPQAYSSDLSYPSGELVFFGGHIWLSTTSVPRGVFPAGVGDGSTADRDLLLQFRGGYALTMGVTGGYAGTTYTVTSTADSGTGSLRSALESSNAYWIVFDKTVFPPGVETTITLASTLTPLPNKTVDGRGSKVFVTSSAQILIQGIGNPTNAGTAFIRYPSGVANMIFTHVRWNTTSPNLNRDNFTCTWGCDGLWFNHTGHTGGTDGTIDISQPDGLGQSAAQALYGNPNPISTRVHLSWCQFGPMPTNANLAEQGPLTGGDNLPENGKTNLWGLINDTPDKLWISADHCWWDGAVQRNPKMWYGMHGHVYNSMTSRWNLVPGVVVNSTQQAAYTALGKTSVIATYGSVATEVSTGAKVLLENNIYKPYQAGDPHVLDGTWPVLFPDPDAINNDGGSTAMRTSGLLIMYGAQRAADVNASSVEARPYPYTLLTADSTLDSDLQTGVGNFQPWQLVS